MNKDKVKKIKDLKKKLVPAKNTVNLSELIISSQNIKNKEKIIKEFKPDDDGFISVETSQKILEKYPTTKSEKIYDIVSDNDDDTESLVIVKPKNDIDLSNSLFNYSGKKFSFIKVDDNFYFKGKEIAEFLEYADTTKAILKYVDDDDKITLGNLLSCVI